MFEQRQRHVPVPNLVKRMAKTPRPAHTAELRAGNAQLDVIDGIYIDSIRFQPKDCLAFNYIQPAFHDMSFGKWNRAGCEIDDVGMQVMVHDPVNPRPLVSGISTGDTSDHR
ncbi:hypothetical protein [Ruegeria atlantica]|uniref:hypothetical protein n=1 Tax=Ruegeria atlantica TaxID=81569 RepID=UPI00147A8E41|nr:hypothetical protein [Ruegeria atlantica]